MKREEKKALYYYKSKPITGKDIELALVESGLKKGDIVMIHSDISSFGKIGDIKDRNKFLKCIINSFLNVIGDEGTLVVPTYTYTFCRTKIFDLRNTKSEVGVFSEFVRNCDGAIRSEDPIFSHAGIGKNAKILLRNVGNVCFGKDSFFDRLYKFDGKIVNFGKFFDITFLHYIENVFKVSYRFNKKFSGKVIKEDGSKYEAEVIFYVRYLPEDGRDVLYNMHRIGNELEKRSLLKRVFLGNSYILCSKTKDIYDIGLEMLKKNEYTFLAKNPNILEFKEMPFFIGLLDSPENNGLPLSLPFKLKFDKRSSLIVQKYSKKNAIFIEEAYKKGSLLSVNLGQGSFGVSRANDVLECLLKICESDISNLSFLEIGCADGYLLHKLKLRGAKNVVGCEPGPMGRKGEEKYGIRILNNFFEPKLFKEKFDLIFSYGVIEHVYNPLKFINLSKSCLKESGKIFVGVPNCENKLRLGDISVLGHEHWNYFTKESLKNLLISCKLTDVNTVVGINEAMIYGWGTNSNSSQEILDISKKTEQLFYTFCGRIRTLIPILQKQIGEIEAYSKTLGLYGGGLNLIAVLRHKFEPRFFDGDNAKYGKFFPGYENPIENPINLITNKVNELWIMAIDYDEEIINYLKKELKISEDVKIFSFKKFLENFNKD